MAVPPSLGDNKLALLFSFIVLFTTVGVEVAAAPTETILLEKTARCVTAWLEIMPEVVGEGVFLMLLLLLLDT